MKKPIMCTFSDIRSLNITYEYIQGGFNIVNKKVHVYSNRQDPTECFLFYNIEVTHGESIQNTITVHRKVHTNTYYTINALNGLVLELNGKPDKNYPIDWKNYRDSLILYKNENVDITYLNYYKTINLNF